MAHQQQHQKRGTGWQGLQAGEGNEHGKIERKKESKRDWGERGTESYQGPILSTIFCSEIFKKLQDLIRKLCRHF